LELKNFFSYGGQWQTINLEEGVNLVLGHDKDKDRSNGAGKTSFLEAIPFALFGQTSKGVPLPKIINWKNGKQCEVKFHFEKDGISYMIHRGIKPGILELVKDGVPVPKLSDKRVFQMELEHDLIGMDFKAAQAILFQNANNMVSIFNTPKAEKRKFIEKFFNLEIYSKMTEHTNTKLGGVTKRLSEIDMEIGFKQKRVEELEMIISESVVPNMSEYKNSVDEANLKLCQLNVDNEQLFTEGPILESQIGDKKTERQGLMDKKTELTTKIGQVTQKISLLQGEITSLEKRNETIGDLTEQREKLVKIQKVLEKLDNIENMSTELTENIDVLKETGSKLMGEYVTFTNEMSRLEKELSKWTDHTVTEETTCPTCFQEVDPEHIKDHIDKLVGELTEQINLVKVNRGELEDLIATNKNDREEFEVSLKTINEKIVKKRQLEKHLVALSGVEEKQKEFDENDKRIEGIKFVEIPEIEKELEELDNDKYVIESDISIVQSVIDEKQSMYDQYKDLQRDKERLTTKFETETRIYNSQKEICDRIELEYETNVTTKTQLESEVSVFNGETKKLNVMKDYLEYIKETLKDTNVKQYAIGNIIPFLQQQTNHYLSETGHNYYIELDAWLDGTIKGYGVGDCEFGNMSGGEGKSIDLALKFAMMDVARRQAGSYLDILVLDELLDSSIDSHGIEKTFDIIRMKQREDNLKVFVVSHREEVADFGVDGTYKVTKEDGFSTIEVV